MNKIAIVAVLITIIVVSLIAFFVLIPAVSKPSIAFKGWYQSGVEVTVAKVNIPVTLTLEATSKVPLEGTLKVEIREDIKDGNDKATATKTHDISLKGGNDSITVETTFTPASKTEGKSKGYFYRLSWNDQLFYDPTDRNSRNQLTVGGEAVSTTLTQTFEGWYQNGVKLISPSPTHPEAKVNVPVTLNVSIINNGENAFSGTVKIEIRKDIKGGNDKSVGFYPSQISVASGESVTVRAIFTPTEKTTGSLRGYFYKVYVGDLCIYDPKTENGQGPDVRPELKVMEAGEEGPQRLSWEFPGKWETTDSEGPQIMVNVGTTVKAYAHVNNPNPSSVSANIKMEIRRDIISGTDNVKTTLIKTVSIPVGVSYVDMGVFVADEQTFESGSGKLREYFMKVWVDGQLVWDPKSENGYGPDTREWVKTSTGATASQVSWKFPGEWSYTIQLAIVTVRKYQVTVPKGTTVGVYAHFNNPGNATIATIKVEVRRDIISGSDNVKATLIKTATIPSGVSFILMGTFLADETTYSSGSGKLREYFMKVWVDGQLVWDPKSENGYGPDTREWVKTS